MSYSGKLPQQPAVLYFHGGGWVAGTIGKKLLYLDIRESSIYFKH